MKFKAAQKKVVAKFDHPEFIKNIKEEDLTMVKHLGILKEINECGLLTTNSQAGNTYERAYILGFMLKKDAIQFIKNMNIDTDKNALYVSISNIDADPKLDIPLTIENQKVITHMSTSVPRRIWENERKQLDLDDDIIYIFCWDPKWNRNASSKMGLFTDVLKILKSM
jgi:hypothetical protein